MVGIREDAKLRINLRNNLIALSSLIIGMTLFLIVLSALSFEYYAILAFGIWFGIDAILTLYLHVSYFLKNRGEEYEVNFDALIRYKSDQYTTYPASEILKIKIYLSPALFRGSNLHFLGIEAYHFARVYLSSGEELIITCLLTPKVENSLSILRGVKFERKKRLLNVIRWK